MLNIQAIEHELAKHLGREEEAEQIDAAREKWIASRTEELALKYSNDPMFWSDAAANALAIGTKQLMAANDDAIEFKRVFDKLHTKELHSIAEWEARKQADNIETSFLLRSARDVWGHD